MSKLFDDTLHFGLGLFAYSKDKVEELVDEMVARGEVAAKDAKPVVDDLIQRGQEERKEWAGLFKETLQDTVDFDEFPTKDEIREIVREELKNILNENMKKSE